MEGKKVQLTKKGIRQSNRINALHSRILDEIRINKEEDGHIHRLASIELLFLKTKALDLAKIRGHLPRCNTVRRNTNDVRRTPVGRRVEGKSCLARENTNFPLLWCEFPR